MNKIIILTNHFHNGFKEKIILNIDSEEELERIQKEAEEINRRGVELLNDAKIQTDAKKDAIKAYEEHIQSLSQEIQLLTTKSQNLEEGDELLDLTNQIKQKTENKDYACKMVEDIKNSTLFEIEDDFVISQDIYVMPDEQAKKTFGEYIYMVSNDTCQISDDNQVTFTYQPPSLEELKQEKLKELDKKSTLFENNLNKDMYFTSSLGFDCNGDRRTRSNIEDLINFFDVQARDEPKTVDYRDYENNIQKLTKEQLTTLLIEHLVNGQSLYNQKWAFQEAIQAAESRDVLEKIDLSFKMSNFLNK